MSIALECRNLHKRFVTGVAGCSATSHVLRGVDLTLRAGDCAAVVGPPAAGKSTLLLCAAGLLRPDGGEVRWYGRTSLASVERAVGYYWTALDCRRTCNADAGIHLVDSVADGDARLFAQWVETRRQRGDVILFGARDESVARALTPLVWSLRNGRLPIFRAEAVARVAEPVV
jgi:ABC-type Mn2+/Zn2+ transport system ATPase subunit